MVPSARMIRPYRPADRDAVLALWAAASARAHPFLDAAFVRAERVAIRDTFLPAATTWVWTEGEQVLGFVSTMEDEIGGLFVAPEAQRRGIGRALVDAVQRSRPGRALELEVFAANAGARAFYAACGFREVARQVHEATGQPALRLRRPAPVNRAASAPSP